MKLLRIKDNSQQKKDAFSQVARLTGKIADKTLEQLEREGVFVFPETVKDAEDITQDQMIFVPRNNSLRGIRTSKRNHARTNCSAVIPLYRIKPRAAKGAAPTMQSHESVSVPRKERHAK